LTVRGPAPWFAASQDVGEILAEWEASAEVGWARSLNVEESRLVLAALAEASRIVEVCAADTTAPDLAQEIEFLKAELAHARGGPPC
jgi:hypothetical protein